MTLKPLKQVLKENKQSEEKRKEMINKILKINFKVGDLIINPKVGLIEKIIRISEKGYMYAIPMVWKDLYIDPMARESCINPFHFRKITDRDFRLFQERGVISGHPERVVA